MGGVIEQPMTKIVDAVEALYGRHGTLPARYPAFLRVARPHRPENTSQGIASSGHTWMHVREPQRSRMATEKREPLSAQKRPCWQSLINQVRLDSPRKRSGHEGVQDAVQPAWNDFGAKRWVAHSTL